jgi:hypothetical protein
VRMQGVARGAPFLVRKRRPCGRHGCTLQARHYWKELPRKERQVLQHPLRRPAQAGLSLGRFWSSTSDDRLARPGATGLPCRGVRDHLGIGMTLAGRLTAEARIVV